MNIKTIHSRTITSSHTFSQLHSFYNAQLNGQSLTKEQIKKETNFKVPIFFCKENIKRWESNERNVEHAPHQEFRVQNASLWTILLSHGFSPQCSIKRNVKPND